MPRAGGHEHTSDINQLAREPAQAGTGLTTWVCGQDGALRGRANNSSMAVWDAPGLQAALPAGQPPGIPLPAASFVIFLRTQGGSARLWREAHIGVTSWPPAVLDKAGNLRVCGFSCFPSFQNAVTGDPGCSASLRRPNPHRCRKNAFLFTFCLRSLSCL